MKNITAKATIEILRDIFARFGLPDTVVSDNGTTFVSEQFQWFMKTNGISHVTSPPYHPASNGLAKRGVQTVKKALKKMRNDTGTVNKKLALFLIQYRKTPHSTTGESPARLMFRRDIHTRIDLVKSSISDRITRKKEKQIKEAKRQSFAIGQKVAVRMIRNDNYKIGEVMSEDSASQYTVSVQGKLVKRCFDQLREVGQDIQADIPDPVLDFASNAYQQPNSQQQNDIPVENEAHTEEIRESNSEPLIDANPQVSDIPHQPEALLERDIPKSTKKYRGQRGVTKDYGPRTRASERTRKAPERYGQ